MLAGVIEIDDLDALGKDRTEVTHVVLRPVGELDQGEIGPLLEHAGDAARLADRLRLSRPSAALMKRPVSMRRARSTPVSMPMPPSR